MLKKECTMANCSFWDSLFSGNLFYRFILIFGQLLSHEILIAASSLSVHAKFYPVLSNPLSAQVGNKWCRVVEKVARGRGLAVITYQERGLLHPRAPDFEPPPVPALSTMYTSSLIVYKSPTQHKRPIEIKRPNPSLVCQNEFLIHANPKYDLRALLKPQLSSR